MAQLKDLLVSGPSRLIGKLFANEVQLTTLSIPTTSNGTIYGPGTNNYIPVSNGTSIYWSSVAPNATTASKLGTNAGSSSQPIYFANGVPVAITGSIGNSITGNAATATKLATARNLGVALGSTTAVTFDGSANQTSIPISGTLAIAHGGTGKTTAAGIYEIVRDNGGDSRWVNASGDTMTGDLSLKTSSADSPDIVWWYGDTNKEQARIWMGSGGTSTFAPNYRCYKSDGTSLYSGTLVLGNGTGASGTWGISISGNAATATTATTANSVAWANISGKPIELAGYSGALNTNGWKTLGGRSSGAKIYIAYNNNAATWNSGTYSSSIVFGCSDTKGLLDIAYNTPVVTFGGSSVNGSTDNAPTWYFKLSGTSGQTYTFPTTSKTLAATDGTGASGTWGISISGNAATATKLATARKLKVALGSTTDVTFDGSADQTSIPVSGTLAITRGGTGLTSSPSMLTNLGSTTAANVLQASPRPGITGTLGVANGGTGKTTAAGIYEVVRDNGGDSRWVNVSGDTMTGTLTIQANLIVGSQASGTTLGAKATILAMNGIASGDYSHAEGYYTSASGHYSHAEGSWTTASGNYSHAEGYYTTVSGDYSHSEGGDTTASGAYSHAEGTTSGFSSYYLIVGNNTGKIIQGSSAYGTGSHAQGQGSVALGNGSHAEGYLTLAIGNYSHAQGYGTIAPSDYSTVIGKYNETEATFDGTTRTYTYTSADDYAFIIGNGTGFQSNQRSNALTVDWDGELIANGQSFRDATRIIEKTTNVTTLTNTICKWRYRQFSNGYIDGYGIISATWSHYIVFSPFYGYYCSVNLPVKFVGDGVIATVSWNIGNAVGISAGVKGNRTTTMNIYALSSASGAQTIIAMIHIKGRIAVPWTGFGIKAVNSSYVWTNNSMTAEGITYTINVDADDKIINITTTGTATASTASFKLYDHSIMSDSRIPNGTYTFMGAPSGGSSTTYCIGIQMYNPSTDTYSTVYDTGNGGTFTQSSTNYVNAIYFRFKSGLNTSGKTWIPKLIKTA